MNSKIVDALGSCRDFLGLDVDCATVQQTASIPATPTSPATTITATTHAVSDCSCCGQDSCGCSCTHTQVDVTKHHEVHMYASKWRRLFFSLLKTIKESKPKEGEDSGDPDIDEAINYYSTFLRGPTRGGVRTAVETGARRLTRTRNIL